MATTGQPVAEAVVVVTADLKQFISQLNVARLATMQFANAVSSSIGSAITSMSRTVASGMNVAISGMKSAAIAAGDLASGIYKAADAAGSSNFSRVLGVGMLALGKSMIESNAMFERVQIAMDSLTGSAENGAAMMAKLKEVAVNTPFTMQGLAKNAQFLMTMGFAAKDVIPIMMRLGDVLAVRGTGDPEQSLTSAVQAMARLNQAPALTTRSMLQFANQGIPVMDALMKKLGKTRQEVQALIHAGQITPQQGMSAVMSLADDPRFKGKMGAMNATFTGMMSNVSDAFTMFAARAGKPLFESAKATATQLFTYLMSSAGNAMADKIAAGFAKVSAFLAPFTGAIKAAIPTILKVGAVLGGLSLIMPILNTGLRIAAPLVGMLVGAFKPLNFLLLGLGYLATKALGDPATMASLSDGFNAASAAVQRFVDQFGGIEGLLTAVWGAFTGFWDYIAEKAGEAWTYIKENAGAAWDWILEKAGAVADAIGPVLTTGLAGAALMFTGIGVAIMKAYDAVSSFVSANAEMVQAVAGTALAVGLVALAIKGVIAVLSALGITQVISAGLWAAWTVAVLFAKGAVLVYSVSVLVLTALVSACTFAIGLFTATLSAASIVSAVVTLVSLGVAAAVVGAVLLVAASAISAFIETGKGLSKLVVDIAGIDEGPLDRISGIFGEWFSILKDVADMARDDIPSAIKLLGAGAKLAFSQLSDVFPPLWEYIKTGFSTLIDYVCAKFSASFSEAFNNSLGALMAGIAAVNPVLAKAMGFVGADPKAYFAAAEKAREAGRVAEAKAFLDMLVASARFRGDAKESPETVEARRVYEELKSGLKKDIELKKVGDAASVIAAGAEGTAGGMETPASPKFDDNAAAAKTGFSGFAELWKKTQEAMGENEMMNFTKRGAMAAEGALPILKGIKEKIKAPPPRGWGA